MALRNVLLFAFDADDVEQLSVEVSDFGLSLSIYRGTHKTVARGPKARAAHGIQIAILGEE